VLFPLLLLFSAFLLLRGHNEPGGGFVGGLVASMAYALVLVAEGPAAARRVLRADPRTIVALGLAVAVASGVPPLLQGRPFLVGLWLGVPLPAVGKLGSPVVFDIGVYLVVLGVVLAMLLALAEEEA
jgi:multicomponent Na+:H+ antiporter subunit B